MEIADKIDRTNNVILKRFRRLVTKDKNFNKTCSQIIKLYKIKDKTIIEYVKKHYKK
jgi:thymidylate synthase ThyX